MISRASSRKSHENNMNIYDYRPNVNFNYFIYDQTFEDSLECLVKLYFRTFDYKSPNIR